VGVWRLVISVFLSYPPHPNPLLPGEREKKKGVSCLTLALLLAGEGNS